MFARFILAGTVSALFCWLGALLVPEPGILLDIYPGLVLGVTLFVLGIGSKKYAPDKKILSFFWLVLFCVAGWRIAVDVGYPAGGDFPFLVAGLFGGLFVSVGLILGWKLQGNLPLFAAIVTVAGGFGGWIFGFIDQALGSDAHPLWVPMLFLEWHLVLMSGISIALHALAVVGTPSPRAGE